jgi:uncharacterized protein (TIGR03067 family)
MRIKTWAFAVLTLLSTVATPLAADSPSEYEAHKAVDLGREPALQGDWKATSIDFDERGIIVCIVSGPSEPFTFRFEAGKVTLKQLAKSESRGTYTVNQDRGEIDFFFGTGPGAGHVFKGIYKIEGDTLTVCVAGVLKLEADDSVSVCKRVPGNERPTRFENKKNYTRYVLKKVKPSEDPQPGWFDPRAVD